MTYTFKVGQYTFTSGWIIEPDILSAVSIIKKLGQSQSIVSDWGPYGAGVWILRGDLYGSTGKTDLASLEAELERPYPILLETDMRGSYYGRILRIRPVERPGFVQDGSSYTYPTELIFVHQIKSTLASRGTLYTAISEEQQGFTLTPATVVPQPVGATSPSETSDFTRYVDNTASGAYEIPCALEPDLTKMTYTLAEADLGKSRVEISAVGTKEMQICNDTARLRSRHDEAGTKGAWEFYYYNKTSWIDLARLQLYATESGSTSREVTGSSKGPEVWPVWPNLPDHERLRMLYPDTATDDLTLMAEFTFDYGKPWVKVQLKNAGPETLSGCEYRLALQPTDFRYWTHDTTEEDAQSGAHGTPDVVAGDSDVNNISFVHTTTGAPAAATILTGFARKKRNDSDDVADDAVNYWDYIAQRFDGLTIRSGQSFEPVWIFAGRYDAVGSRTAAQLGLEALKKIVAHQTIIPKV